MKGLLIVISGFSGVGKGTLCKELLKRYPEEYGLSVSATSRNPRPGEQDGREYFFVSRNRFEQMIADEELIEHCSYNGNYYGTPKKYVQERLAQGKNVILEIEVQGDFQIKQKFPEAFLLFVLPPDAVELNRRLRERGTESEADIRKRLSRALEEADFITEYDDVLVNGDFEKALSDLHGKIRDRKDQMNQKLSYVEGFKSTLKDILNREESNVTSVL